MPTYCLPDALTPSEPTAPTVTPIVATSAIAAPIVVGAIAPAEMPKPCEPEPE